MPRLPGIVVPGVPHHITQRGNFRQVVFESDADREHCMRLWTSCHHGGMI
jgi:putative transposase